MATLNANLKAAISATYSATGLATASASLVAQDDIGITSGTGSYQADLMFAQTRTLTTGATDNLDLSGVLTDPLGTVITALKIVAILIRSRDANTTDLTVGNGTNPFLGPFGAAAHTLVVTPGSPLMLANVKTGWTVTPATADILKIVNGAGASATYDIVVLGRSA
jgi:hypothetical protein